MNGINNLTVSQVVLVIVRVRRINREKEILISSIRMTLQLILTGFILTYVFDNPNPFITVGIILLMEAFAVYTVFNKFTDKLSNSLKRVIAFSMGVGTLTCLLYFLLIVVRVNPWYDPQYFIPIAGMFVGNSMTGMSLGVKSLLEGMTTQRAMIEEALILGATPNVASRSVVNSAFNSAIIPTINSMVGMGIVFLPGLMTGQILSGTAPTTAIAYQISIMLGILGAVALSVIIMLQLGCRTFFNMENQQLL
ncbi:hypothetical protein Tph_c29140 [Thermacetogenium phaeum DSM 12270]|uniref:Iron export ABC transporter permease subunit FetB n=1 Tax=Thermacetogenium phaeum (strain ATCC BAA-254 / DSM 26808 / PB) TaxID=1089553 RepID=K4LJ98_THEPS|nr:iron export ABC transporter permease subunit FetB [Thermacetogenium phaeum]AFV13076.1 hypothetical protein Tph_c29140 [Thermacetogenium phaeum DSM 12270]